jgi:hypothetical protein
MSVSEELREKFERFKELIKSGVTVREALKEAGLSAATYQKYKEVIWCSPDMKPYRSRANVKCSDDETSNKFAASQQGAASGESGEKPSDVEIGRASCRERV